MTATNPHKPAQTPPHSANPRNPPDTADTANCNCNCDAGAEAELGGCSADAEAGGVP